MELERLHWVTVAHGDLKTPGRHQTPFSRGRLRRTSQESTRRSESGLASQEARWSLTPSLGHCCTWRPQDTGKAPDAVLTREASENVTGVDKTFGKRSRGVVGKMEPDVALYDSWEAPDDIRDQEASGSNKRGPHEQARRSDSSLEGLAARRSLSIFMGSRLHMATTIHREGAGRNF
jgi:hypothetical protein